MKLKLFMIAIFAIALTGCATNRGGNSYTNNGTQQMQRVLVGTVESTRGVTISANSGVGGSAGAGIGAVAGSNVGAGRGSLVGIIGGAVIGGLIGHAADSAANSKEGMEITVKLDNGELVAVTQTVAESDAIAKGDRVRILVAPQGTSRVQRL